MIKNRITYIFVLTFAIAFSFFYSGELVYIFIISVITLPVLSFLTARISLFFVKANQYIDDTSFIRGQNAVYNVVFLNSSLVGFVNTVIYFTIKTQDSIITQRVVFDYFRARADSAAKISFVLEHKGWYTAGAQRIVYYDFLRLFKFKRKFVKKSDIMVYPRVYGVKNLLIKNSLSSDASRKLSFIDDNNQFSDLRNYMEGDSVRKIHWKMSAKRGNLVVKNYNNPLMGTLLIFMDDTLNDLSKPNRLQLEDALADTALSILNYAATANFTVILKSSDIGDTTHGRGRFEKLRALIAETRFKQHDGFFRLINEYFNLNTDTVNAVFISANPNALLCSSILDAVKMGHSAKVYFICADKENADNENTKILRDGGAETQIVIADGEMGL